MKYIFLLITWFCGSFGILSAQEIQVKSFQKLDRDLEARKTTGSSIFVI